MIKVTIINETGSGAAGEATVTPNTGLVRRLVVSTPITEDILGTVPTPFPGVVEQAWFDDESAAAATYGYRSIAKLTAPAAVRRFVARENVVVPKAALPPPGTVKLLAFIRRRQDLSAEEFQRYWADIHAPLVKKTPILRGYVQSHPLMEHYADGHAPIFDGTAELWWDTIQDYRASWASAEIQKEQRADVLNFLARTGDMYNCITVERVVF